MLKLENSIRGLSFSRVAFDLTIQAKRKEECKYIPLNVNRWGDIPTSPNQD